MRILFLRNKLILLLCFCLFMISCAKKAAEKQPNIIIILADDLGYGDPEIYNQESKIPTPNINALAKSGMRFTDAHSPSSVCTPTRYGILTGRYAWRSELKSSVLWQWDRPLIEKERFTLPKMLNKKGYVTACIGKWHLGWRWPGKNGGFINNSIDIGNNNLKGRNELYKAIDFTKSIGGGPLEAGFDYYFGDDVPNFAPYTFFENDRLLQFPDTIKPSNMFGGYGPMVKDWDLTKVMPNITEKSVKYIDEQSKTDKPFFLYFALTAPHTPIAPSQEFIGKSKAGLYGDYVHQVDFTVGEILKKLKETNQLENTIVIFTSDNGSPQRDGTNMSGSVGSVKKYEHNPSGNLKGTKADIWEGGHRVPFIVSWPKKIQKNKVSNQLFGLNDIMATLSGLTGKSEENVVLEDSIDFSQVFLGEEETTVRETLVNHSSQGMFAIRKGKWKLILGKGSGGWSKNNNALPLEEQPRGQLYNLETDIREHNNVYDKHPDLVSELTLLLDNYKRQDNGLGN